LGAHIIGLFSGETAQERLARQRFEAYKNFIFEEAKLSEMASNQHNVHRKSLIIDFSEQAIQLQRWGLTHILPFFRMQAWLRISRTLILEEIASLSRASLMDRVDVVSEAIQLSSVSGLANKHSFLSSRLDEVCRMPEDLASCTPELMSLQYRLQKMDKMCQITLRKFKIMLPEVEAKSTSERRDILIRILTKYRALNECMYPEGIDIMSWDEFTSWYQQHHRDMRDLERGFGNFVEDDREKEGRLFRRWCTLANTNSGDNMELIGAERVVDKDAEEDLKEGLFHGGSASDDTPACEKIGIDGSPSKASALAMKLKLSPRTISAFTKYFSKQVMAVKYKCPQDLIDTLVAITESIVFRRITAVTFR
jgi:DNA-binding MarR family transcriptional regulator